MSTLQPLESARLEPLDEAEMSPEQLEMIAPLRERYGFVFNVLKTMMRNMPLLNAWNPLAGHIMSASSLTPRQRELMILRVGWRRHCEYEWGQHVLMSQAAGLTTADHDRVREGAGAEGWSAEERALISATDELLEHTMLSDAAWSELTAHFSEEQIMDAIFTVGQYNMLAMALNSLGVQREDGVPGF